MLGENQKYSKWVACWGTATSITKRTENTYSKNLTLRYPLTICFNGSKLRFRFSNLTGSEDVKVTKAFCARKNQGSYTPLAITKNSSKSFLIPAGKEIESDELSLEIKAGEIVDISLYFGDFTQMNAGTAILSPFGKGYFAYGDYSEAENLPEDLSMATNIFYFLNTIDIYTEEKNQALVCYGDSITCCSWTDYLSKFLFEKGLKNLSVIRRAVCGTRILRQYECITYQSYGLKGQTRFPIEINTSGVSGVILHHGINDIIHPVGVEVNPFRPWSDMPSLQELKDAFENIYVKKSREMGLKVLSATLLPIFGWRTYTQEREKIRQGFNDWLRRSSSFDGFIDFDKVLRDPEKTEAFLPLCDSGDHLHPSEEGCKLMAEEAAKFF